MVSEIQYFPNIHFFHLHKHQDLIIEQNENYQKGSLRNKCKIMTSNGLLNLSIPLRKGKNSKQNIKDVKIAYDVDWQKHHWMTIKSAYGKAAFFCDYDLIFEKLIFKKNIYLFDHNIQIIENILPILNCTNSILYTESYDGTNRHKIDNLDPKNYREYPQVFSDRFPFHENLSIIDLVMNVGPESMFYI